MPSVAFKPLNPSKQTAVDLRRRPQDHSDQLSPVLYPCNYATLTELSDKPTE